MKLLLCDECFDVFRLDYELRTCKCGKVAGKYLNNTEAVVNGKGFSLAIGNGSLMMATRRASEQRSERRPPESDVICWVRPHEGAANPHTTVNPTLGS